MFRSLLLLLFCNISNCIKLQSECFTSNYRHDIELPAHAVNPSLSIGSWGTDCGGSVILNKLTYSFHDASLIRNNLTHLAVMLDFNNRVVGATKYTVSNSDSGDYYYQMMFSYSTSGSEAMVKPGKLWFNQGGTNDPWISFSVDPAFG